MQTRFADRSSTTHLHGALTTYSDLMNGFPGRFPNVVNLLRQERRGEQRMQPCGVGQARGVRLDARDLREHPICSLAQTDLADFQLQGVCFFSTKNLSKDEWLTKELDRLGGLLSVSTIQTFNKIALHDVSCEYIAKVVQGSRRVSVHEYTQILDGMDGYFLSKDDGFSETDWNFDQLDSLDCKKLNAPIYGIILPEDDFHKSEDWGLGVLESFVSFDMNIFIDDGHTPQHDGLTGNQANEGSRPIPLFELQPLATGSSSPRQRRRSCAKR